jgi:hypothetical protein
VGLSLDVLLILSQLSRARMREGNSDKFGHANCAILRESAIRRFEATAVNALNPAHLSGNCAILRSG